MKSGIYKILNTHNRMIYVGSAVDFQQRFYLHIYHLNANTHFNKHLQNAWNKYGENAFEFKILEFCEKDNLIKREQHWIDWTLCYQREIGYNSRRKAETNLGLQWSEETKRKMGQKNIGRKHTQEHKDKVIKALTGRFVSNETKIKISLSNKGNKNRLGMTNSKEHNLKIGLANQQKRIGTKASEETKKKISLAGKGRIASAETKLKLSIAAKKRYAIICTQTPIIIGEEI